MDIFNYLFPNSTQFKLSELSVKEVQKKITLKLSSKQTLIGCPKCNQSTNKIHSYYERTLNDLLWADHRINLILRVRKFFCRNPECNRHIFTERLDKLASPWARRTTRLTNQLTAIALELGGSAGARLANYLNHLLSRNTLLALIRRIPLPPIVTPLILGVDEECLPKKKDLWNYFS